MDLHLFNDQPETPAKEDLESTDAEKFQKIVSILCDKRKVLEEKLKIKDSSTFADDGTQLLDLVKEMKTFGISEIDYQKWLAAEAKGGR